MAIIEIGNEDERAIRLALYRQALIDEGLDPDAALEHPAATFVYSEALKRSMDEVGALLMAAAIAAQPVADELHELTRLIQGKRRRFEIVLRGLAHSGKTYSAPKPKGASKTRKARRRR